MSEFYNNSIFWVEVDRISPNPYQPRKEFNDEKIEELADSIRQYGILQPLVVTRKETEREDGGITVEYELIAGERRLRASKIAMLPQVPVIIRAQEETNKVKLELAIIENLQREDLNSIDRAVAFKQLVDEFNLKHIEIAKKVGKSREYVSNTLRLLGLPENIQQALVARQISEGHARPLLMLGERPAERDTLFEEIKMKKLTVRESERIARRIATDKARKQDLSPELVNIEKNLTKTLGTRVQIEQRSKNGGKVHIDYFSEEDLKRLLDILAQEKSAAAEKPNTKNAPQANAPQATQNIHKKPHAPQNNQNKSSFPKKGALTKSQPQVKQTQPQQNIHNDAPKVDPFKQFELPKNTQTHNTQQTQADIHVPRIPATPKPQTVNPFAMPATPTPSSNPFAGLPPLPPLPNTAMPAAAPANTIAPQESFNPFAQSNEPLSQPAQAATPQPELVNPFADLPPLPSAPTQVEQHDMAPFNPFAAIPETTVPAPKAPVNPFAAAPQGDSFTQTQSINNNPDIADDDLYSIKNFAL